MKSEESKIQEVREKIYFLESIQESAKPQITLDREKMHIDIDNVWISNHYDDDDDVPTKEEVANDIFDIIKEKLPDYNVSVLIHDRNGKRKIFNK